MTRSQTIELRKTFEQLAAALSLHGWKDFEVSFDSDELGIERHGGAAACSIVMLPYEPVFQGHLVYTTGVVRAVSFTIGAEAAGGTAQAPTQAFRDPAEAAQWLLNLMGSQSAKEA